ncbi:MAG: hypothetical protein Kow00104_09460 [Rhodothalassiaceae bacterium]
MPKEYREITFDMEEIGEAMLDYAAAQSPELSIERTSDIRVETDGLAIVFDEEHEMRFSQLEITAALIRHAKKIGVPVARKARKALVPGKSGITLRLWLPDMGQESA